MLSIEPIVSRSLVQRREHRRKKCHFEFASSLEIESLQGIRVVSLSYQEVHLCLVLMLVIALTGRKFGCQRRSMKYLISPDVARAFSSIPLLGQAEQCKISHSCCARFVISPTSHRCCVAASPPFNQPAQREKTPSTLARVTVD